MDGTETRTPLQKQNEHREGIHAKWHYPFIPYLSAIAMHIYAKSNHSEAQIPVNSLFFYHDSHNTYSPSQRQLPHQRPLFQTRVPGDLLLLPPLHAPLSHLEQCCRKHFLQLNECLCSCPTVSMSSWKPFRHPPFCTALDQAQMFLQHIQEKTNRKKAFSDTLKIPRLSTGKWRSALRQYWKWRGMTSTE